MGARLRYAPALTNQRNVSGSTLQFSPRGLSYQSQQQHSSSSRNNRNIHPYNLDRRPNHHFGGWLRQKGCCLLSQLSEDRIQTGSIRSSISLQTADVPSQRWSHPAPLHPRVGHDTSGSRSVQARAKAEGRGGNVRRIRSICCSHAATSTGLRGRRATRGCERVHAQLGRAGRNGKFRLHGGRRPRRFSAGGNPPWRSCGNACHVEQVDFSREYWNQGYESSFEEFERVVRRDFHLAGVRWA